MNRTLFLSPSFLALSGLALAQAPAPAGPLTHPGEAVTLEHFVITASAFERAQADLAQATTVLAGNALLPRRAPTLGETLAGLPGLHSTWFGPGASRPVVRGFDGDRVRLLENSTATLDASVLSPDHAVAVEPFLIDRVEVVRGPASLLYGGSAVGGVVNVLTRRIARELPARAVSGTADLRFDTGADERSAGAAVDVTVPVPDGPALVLHLDGFRREAGDIDIPGFAESAHIRAEEIEHAEEHGEPPPRFARDRLPNSALQSQGAAGGLTWVGAQGHLGFTRSFFATEYGVPGHAHAGENPVRIDLQQRRWDLSGETRERSGLFSGGRLKFGQADYEHRELAGPEVGTIFRHRGHDLRAELLHDDLRGLAGTWGVQTARSNLEALGDEAFLPPSRTTQQAVFIFEEFRRSRWTGEFGARHERQKLVLRDGSGRTRRDDATSLSVGAVWNPAPGWTTAFSLVRTERAPNTQEAYAYGPHVGTNSFTIGNAALARERSVGAELSLRKRSGRITGELTLFSNRFRDYIYEQPNGLLAVETPAGHVFVDPAALPGDAEALPVYVHVQTDARFHGAEAEFLLHLHDTAQHRLDLRLAADTTRAEDGDGRPLPRIPADRFTAGLQWHRGGWGAGIEWQHTGRQDRTAPGETSTAGYGLWQAQVNWRLERGRHAWDFHVRGTNLTNTEARPHTSFLKDLAPLPGRNLTAGVRWSF